MRSLIFFNLIQLVLLPTLALSQGKARVVDEKVNENNGTFVTRSIIKKKSSDKSGSEITVRIFQYFWKPMAGGPDAAKLIYIDSVSYSLNAAGELTTSVNTGNHTLGIGKIYNESFSSFTPRKLRFRKRRHYYIDIYLGAPFPPGHH